MRNTTIGNCFTFSTFFQMLVFPTTFPSTLHSLLRKIFEPVVPKRKKKKVSFFFGQFFSNFSNFSNFRGALLLNGIAGKTLLNTL